MQLSEIAHIIQAQLQGQDLTFSGISTDTRQLQAGQLFFALKGEQFDAHDFITQAEARGAAAVVVSRPITTNLPLLLVVDPLQALADLAHHHRQQYSCPVIAVTGSCGKTTTKMILASIFSSCGQVLASPASFNNAIGVPLTLLQLGAQHDYAVIELGANHMGEIHALSQLTHPDVAIITNAAAAHLEGFGDLMGVARTKADIYDGLTAMGVAVINADDQHAAYWWTHASARTPHLLTFGIERPADIYAQDIGLDAQGCAHFILGTPQGKHPVQLALMGRHNVYNALAACAAAYACQLDLATMVRGLEAAHAVDKRLVAYEGQAGSIIIDDSYNANPTSMLAAIQLLAQRAQRSILVMGDMLELGQQTDEFHQQVGIQAKQHGIGQLFCLGEHSRQAVDAFGDQAFHFQTHDQLIAVLKAQLNAEVTVLVKGSRGMSMEKIVIAIKK